MRASEILRSLAGLLDTIDGSERREETVSVKIEPEPIAVKSMLDKPETDDTERANPDDTMFVPPLQAKIELLKKSVGVPNHYEDEGDNDEIALLKKAAGIVTARQVASDDEPLDN